MYALKATLVKAILRLCSMLPLEWARALGRGGAHCYHFCGGRGYRVTRKNLDLVFPELAPQERRNLARESLAASGELIAEMGHIWLRPWPYVAALLIRVQGDQLIRKAQAAGRGVVVLAPHLGNWEVLGLHLATLGDTVSMYEPPKLSGLGPVVERARQRTGATLVPTDSGGVGALLKNVKRGGIAGILPDQIPADLNAGVNAPFMGVPCFTGTLAVNLIRRTGALAVYGYAQRIPRGFMLRYELADKAIYDDDTTLSLAALNRGVESCLRQCVTQYQWEYKRFRVRPKKGPGFYKNL